ncbi:MAG: diguanylate cyclase [Gammaproteobacteria bacterium]|nr:diguanylate cyclase [Gammaproteobacteria bacterium]
MTENTATTSNDKPKVLVVDDSRVLRRAISKILVNDADIIEAEHGEDGWQKLAENDQVQVLITDIEMPVLDGYQLICRIRASEETRIRNLPIITITGAEDEETKARAFACGATDFIIKPLDKVQLQARVQAHAKADNTSRKLEETAAALEEEATTDPLTGLASRRYFLQRVDQDMAHAVRHNTGLTLMRVDIDHFKRLYQKHGDDVADQILVYIARSLQAAARKEDTVARVGGSEFSIIAPSTSKTDATVLADRMRSAIAKQPFNSGDADVPLTLSIGIATYGTDKAESLDALLELVETRLRSAKAEGGNCISASARNEAVATDTEEVTLDAPAPVQIDEPVMDDSDVPMITEELITMEPVIDDTRELTIEEAEALIRYESESLSKQAKRLSVSNTRAAPNLPTGLPVELVNINQILEMLNNGQADKVSPYLLDLAIRILPLLEQCNQHHKLGLASAIDSIKEKLFSLK